MRPRDIACARHVDGDASAAAAGIDVELAIADDGAHGVADLVAVAVGPEEVAVRGVETLRAVVRRGDELQLRADLGECRRTVAPTDVLALRLPADITGLAVEGVDRGQFVLLI